MHVTWPHMHSKWNVRAFQMGSSWHLPDVGQGSKRWWTQLMPRWKKDFKEKGFAWWKTSGSLEYRVYLGTITFDQQNHRKKEHFIIEVCHFKLRDQEMCQWYKMTFEKSWRGKETAFGITDEYKRRLSGREKNE